MPQLYNFDDISNLGAGLNAFQNSSVPFTFNDAIARGEQINNHSNFVGQDVLDGFLNQFTGAVDYDRNLALQQQAQQFSQEETALNREWLERMSNSSYQRAVADLKAAGLNPYLAYQQGGATVPSSSFASAQANGFGRSGNGFQWSFNLLGDVVKSISSAFGAQSRSNATILSAVLRALK